MTLKRANEITKTFRNHGEDYTPNFHKNIRVILDHINDGVNLYLNINNKDYRYGRLYTFFNNFISNNEITLKDDIIQEDYVFTSIGLVKKEEFDEAKRIVEENETTEVIPPRNLLVDGIYQLKDGRIVYHLGMYFRDIDIYHLTKPYGGVNEGSICIEKNNRQYNGRYFIELEETTNGFKFISLFERKTKDIAVKQIMKTVNQEKLMSFLLSNTAYYKSLILKRREAHSKVELVVVDEDDSFFSYTLYKYEDEFYIVSVDHHNNKIYKINDYLAFKNGMYSFMDSNNEEMNLDDYLELSSKTFNLNETPKVKFFYE